MSVYLMLCLFSVILLVIRHSNLYVNYIARHFIIVFSFLILFILYVFRSYSVGSDYPMYGGFYLQDNFHSLIVNHIELGYAYLNALAQHFNNFLIIPIIVSILFILSIYILGKSFKLNYFSLISFFVLTYFYLVSFNILRQYIAISIICIGISLLVIHSSNYIKRRIRILSFIIIVIIASAFHHTALFCLIFLCLLIPKHYYKRNTVMFSGLLTIILFYTGLVKKLFMKLIALSPSYTLKYSQQSQLYVLQGMGNKGIIQLIPVIIQFIFLYIFISHLNVKSHKYKQEVCFILYGYLIYLLMYSAGGNIIADRLQCYTYIFPLIYSCMFVDNNIMVNNANKIYNITKINSFTKMLFILFWIIYYILRLLTNNSGVVPYLFI